MLAQSDRIIKPRGTSPSKDEQLEILTGGGNRAQRPRAFLTPERAFLWIFEIDPGGGGVDPPLTLQSERLSDLDRLLSGGRVHEMEAPLVIAVLLELERATVSAVTSPYRP